MRFKESLRTKSSEGSAYWTWYWGTNNGHLEEDFRANPDVLSEENSFSPWHGLAEADEANLHAYYRAIARGALRRLTPRERAVWKATFFDKMTLTDAATELGISISTVRSSLKRAAEKIHTFILRERKQP